MSQPSPEVQEAELDSLKVVRFRRDMLMRAGYEWADAKAIARQTDVDWHDAVAMLHKTADSALSRRLVL